MYSSAFVPHFCRHSFFFFCACYGDHRDLHSFPTRRSSDLDSAGYAVAEISIDDYVLHGRSRTTQSVVWVSSTDPWHRAADIRSEEHTSELQSHHELVCRLLLEKKKTNCTDGSGSTSRATSH